VPVRAAPRALAGFERLTAMRAAKHPPDATAAG
jgi:hypothetical protein